MIVFSAVCVQQGPTGGDAGLAVGAGHTHGLPAEPAGEPSGSFHPGCFMVPKTRWFTTVTMKFVNLQYQE